MIKENHLEQGMFGLTKKQEYLEIILISIGIFFAPMVIPTLLKAIFGSTSMLATNSQYVVGTLVNTSLIVAGINVKGWKKNIGIITLPSISAMMSGCVFQTTSIYLVYMIPFIWLGNLAIIYLYRYLFVHKKLNYAVASFFSILVKVGIIFTGFKLLVATTIINGQSKIAQMLTVAMSSNQIITATLGSITAFIIMNILYKRTSLNEK